jgi:hypothetical protein
MIVEGKKFVWKNDRSLSSVDVVYASVTAPEITRVEVKIDDNLLDVVYVGGGGSHSWWTNGGGKLIPSDRYPHGIPPNSTLTITSEKVAAIRVDFL